MSQIFQNKEWKIEFGANVNQEESVADAEKRCLTVLRGWLRQKPYRVQQFEQMMPDFGWIWEELVAIYGKPEVPKIVKERENILDAQLKAPGTGILVSHMKLKLCLLNVSRSILTSF